MESRICKIVEKEALWKTRIEACAQSGLSEKAFCQNFTRAAEVCGGDEGGKKVACRGQTDSRNCVLIT